ncbi:hypothetical protein E4U56_002389 [Claviceps arundinis]|uniref:Uncharacterized protein n=1 Tax=Claviceps arundinis TaxID=1623583 RepID=A0A9P7SPB9_9HYPO|nr:hypothetical protein E4U56_002389 [Claviceps arundinis]
MYAHLNHVKSPCIGTKVNLEYRNPSAKRFSGASLNSQDDFLDGGAMTSLLRTNQRFTT